MKKNKRGKRRLAEYLKYLAFAPVAKATGLLSEAEEASGDVAKGDIFDIMKSFISWAVAAIGLLGVIMFIVAGFNYLTAGGDEGKIETAKKAMWFAIYGIATVITEPMAECQLLNVVVLRSGLSNSLASQISANKPVNWGMRVPKYKPRSASKRISSAC